jgi:hypothetical protein
MLTLALSATSPPSFFPSVGAPATLESLSLSSSSSSSLQHEQSDLLLDEALFTFFADECFLRVGFGGGNGFSPLLPAAALVRSFRGIVAMMSRKPALPELKENRDCQSDQRERFKIWSTHLVTLNCAALFLPPLLGLVFDDDDELSDEPLSESDELDDDDELRLDFWLVRSPSPAGWYDVVMVACKENQKQNQ